MSDSPIIKHWSDAIKNFNTNTQNNDEWLTPRP